MILRTLYLIEPSARDPRVDALYSVDLYLDPEVQRMLEHRSRAVWQAIVAHARDLIADHVHTERARHSN